MAASNASAALIASRVGAGTLGAYALAWGFTALVTVLGRTAGINFGEASNLATMLALLLLLVAFCWAFAAANLTRVWSVLVLGGAAMTLAAWLLSRTLTA